MTRAVFLVWLAACGYAPLDRLCPDPGSTACAAIDASCTVAHLAATQTVPSIALLIDRSASMIEGLGTGNKYSALRDALVGVQGAVTQLEHQVYFGAALYTEDAPCPTLYSVDRAVDNRAAIASLIDGQAPLGGTPTAPALDAVVASFAAKPPPQGSPPIIVLATDGLPNQCGTQAADQVAAVTAARNAFSHGVRVVVLSVGDTAGTGPHFQDMANAGQGVAVGQPNAAYYPATTPAQLSGALQTIIRGALSCDLTLDGRIDAAQAASGDLTLGGSKLIFGTDWALDADGVTIHVVGSACTALKGPAPPMLAATFGCDRAGP